MCNHLIVQQNDDRGHQRTARHVFCSFALLLLREHAAGLKRHACSRKRKYDVYAIYNIRTDNANRHIFQKWKEHDEARNKRERERGEYFPDRTEK